MPAAPSGSHLGDSAVWDQAPNEALQMLRTSQSGGTNEKASDNYGSKSGGDCAPGKHVILITHSDAVDPTLSGM
jgi:hypothetical protein